MPDFEKLFKTKQMLSNQILTKYFETRLTNTVTGEERPVCHFQVVITFSSLALLSIIFVIVTTCIIVIILSSKSSNCYHVHHCRHFVIPNSKNANNVVFSSQVGRTMAPLTRLFPCCSSSSVSGRNRHVVILIFNRIET